MRSGVTATSSFPGSSQTPRGSAAPAHKSANPTKQNDGGTTASPKPVILSDVHMLQEAIHLMRFCNKMWI